MIEALIKQLQDLQARVMRLETQENAGAGGSVAWGDVTGKPSTFAPSAHTHPSSEVTDFAEAVDDRVAALLVAGTNVTLTYNDAGNALTIAASGTGTASDSDQDILAGIVFG